MRHIICFGNSLHGDDGFGTAVYQRLSKLPLPSDTHLFDAGTPGLNAMALFSNCSEAIIVDAIAPQGKPGRLHYLRPQELVIESSLPGHGLGVAYLLQAIFALDEPMPDIHILGVEVMKVTSFTPGLSGPVARAVDQAIECLSPYFEMQGNE